MTTTTGMKWKTFLSKIHPPLPMSKRDSQFLAALLSTSFKEQLDRHRPLLLEDHDRLLKLILRNPHFDGTRDAKSEATTSTPRPRVSDHYVELRKDFQRPPMVIFREHVAAGTATIKTAMLCLQAEHGRWLASPNATVGEAMRSSNTASTILDWLWYSQTDMLNTLIEHRGLFSLLLPFLVAEKRYDSIWHWLQLLHPNSSSTSSDQARTATERTATYNKLLVHFVQSEARLGGGLDAATAIFVRAANELKDDKRGKTYIAWSALYLTHLIRYAPKTARLRLNTIPLFMEATGTLSKPTTYMSALHWVYLAEVADPMVALKYLEAVKAHKLSRTKRYAIVELELKAIQLLIKEDRESEALWIMNELQVKFANEVGCSAASEADEPLRGTPQEAEASSLRLLEALATH